MSVRGLLITAAVVAAGIATSLGLAAWVLALDQATPAKDPAAAAGAPPVPAPRLQIEPARELAGLLDRKRERLHGTGWVDAGAGIAHIPIEDAMRQVAEQGLPRWAPPQDGEDAPDVTAHRARERALRREEQR